MTSTRNCRGGSRPVVFSFASKEMSALVQSLVGVAKGAWEADANHLLLELGLVLLIVYFMLQKRYEPKRGTDDREAQPTKEEFDQMLADWKPEPLILPNEKLPSMLPVEPLVVSSPPTPTIKIGNKSFVNLACTNFLGFATHPKATEAAKKALQKYGCGACGPRGFYGTIDVHDVLEKHLARFFQFEEAIIYSSAYATMSSIIPTFAARGDILIVDDCVNHSIRLGADLSRSEVFYYRHNDMKHLEEILQKIKSDDLNRKRKLGRRFIIFEGLCFNTGEIAPLKQIVELKEKYCWRVLVDDSYAVGVLGKTGRGSLEHHGVAPNVVEMVAASLGNAIGSVGGFCVGSYSSVYHQRLNSSGYVFSASPPPYLVSAADAALTLLEQPETSKTLEDLRARANQLRTGLSRISGVTVGGSVDSPVIHVRLAQSRGTRLADEQFWQNVVEQAKEQDLAVTRAHYNPQEERVPAPSLRVTVAAQHTTEDITTAVNVLSSIIKSALSK